LAVDLLAVVFLAVDLLAVVFLAVDLLAVVFLAVDLLAVVFLALVFLALVLLAGTVASLLLALLAAYLFGSKRGLQASFPIGATWQLMIDGDLPLNQGGANRVSSSCPRVDRVSSTWSTTGGSRGLGSAGMETIAGLRFAASRLVPVRGLTRHGVALCPE
jgi:hypothetical protein